MDITEFTVHELLEKLNNDELTSKEIVKAYKSRIEEKEKDVQAFITTTLDEAEEQAEKIDAKRKEKSVKKNVSRVAAGKRQRNEKEFI